MYAKRAILAATMAAVVAVPLTAAKGCQYSTADTASGGSAPKSEKQAAKRLARAAKGAGFHGQKCVLAVAVGLGESGGDPRSHNTTGADNSYGYWQINMNGSMGPARRRKYHLSSNSDLYNGATNAKIAWSMSRHGRSWSPWGAYTNGSYRNHLSAANYAC